MRNMFTLASGGFIRVFSLYTLCAIHKGVLTWTDCSGSTNVWTCARMPLRPLEFVKEPIGVIPPEIISELLSMSS